MNPSKPNDKLKLFFREIKMEEPSPDLMKNILLRIEKESAVEKRKRRTLYWLSLVAGIAVIVLIPALAFHFLNVSIQAPNPKEVQSHLSVFITTFKDLHIEPSMVGLGMVVLLLLVGDLLFRKFAGKHHELNELSDY